MPTVLTNSVIAGVTPTSATSGGSVTASGSATVTAIGVCYSTTSQTPTVSDSHTTITTIVSSFSSDLTGLTSGATYYVRAYATSTAGTGYGGVIKFTTTTTANATTAVVSTFAGNGAGGLVNSTGTGAQFYTPLGMAADAQGNLYIADQFNHVIRKVTQAGVVTTFCGSGVNGHADGSATTAAFYSPNAIAYDSATGNLYVTDQGSNLIIKITPDGTATTLAGIGAPGYVNSATALKAAFNNPQGIAVSKASGNILVADAGNNRIRLITPAGVVSTFTGSGYTNSQVDSTSAYATFSKPSGLAFDSKGNLYVADNLNHAIRKITTDGTVKTFIGNSVQTTLVGNPIAIAFDSSDNLYITDVTGRVLKYNSATSILYDLAGTSGTYGYADGVNTAAQFSSPNGIAVFGGSIFIADAGNNRIRKVVVTN
ncbi:NHL repeat-containing protein [Mucilaginibacter polytrichastri]|uniref:Fibronectin type-III domain-containing protein n=1 Tax=Mucilaginibacter polytrichastri TaxID=1302689 RepID=A0A1Q6A5V6_9SPHI|nr:hypothetical protein [Mucilaginibacter polytrichastri]OKS89400.1 hypothetical protein RG47T_4884 [Mucilaginibacter polytrichastri]